MGMIQVGRRAAMDRELGRMCNTALVPLHPIRKASENILFWHNAVSLEIWDRELVYSDVYISQESILNHAALSWRSWKAVYGCEWASPQDKWLHTVFPWVAAFTLLSSPFSSIFQHHTEQKTLGEEEAEALSSIPKEKDELDVRVNYLRYPGRPKEHCAQAVAAV